MRRRLLVSLAAAALLGSVFPATVAAADPTAQRFGRVEIGKVDPKLLPALIDPARVVDVMIELVDEPVAGRVGDAEDAGTAVTPANRDDWRSQIKTGQKPVADAVRKSGGRIISQMQDAFNGIHAHVRTGDLPALAALPGVSAIHLVPIHKPALEQTVPYVGAPQAWTSTGQTGAGVKIAVIDTGIDFYHADFGGSGDPADYAYGMAHNTTAPATNADGTTVAFPSSKIPMGWDFVGDDYDASAPAGSPATVPHPDANPLDCNGHGTHTASTAAGTGVLSDGSTYTGAYSASIYSTTDFRIGPGVAPRASLYIYRVFGCEGSTDVVTEAIDRAVADGADVISMSLGSDFGSASTPDAIAANNAARAGVVVVASSGNEGSGAYMTGTPASSTRTISVAAIDTHESFPGASIGLASGAVPAINANDGPLPRTGRLNVLMDGGSIALGCDASEYASVSAGDIVVTRRGVCARVDRAALGQAAGAAAVIMVNNAAGLPPFEGPIPGVTIAFLGVDASAADALVAAAGATVTVASTGPLVNPGYKALADFSSWGPRSGDSAIKPEIAAPGVSVVAAGMGTGDDILVNSGTSMAAPHVAGVAALVVDAHPHWRVNEVKAAILSTADTSVQIAGYAPIGAGSGLVQAQRATTTAAIALTRDKLDTLSFAYVAISRSYSASKSFTIENKGSKPITYKLSAAFIGSAAGARVSVSPSVVTVPGFGSRDVTARLSMTASAVKALPFADTFAGMGPGAVFTIQGLVTAAPTTVGSGIYPLRVPFLVAPRGLSNVKTGPLGPYTVSEGVANTSVRLSNSGVHDGTADVYAWGLYSKDTPTGLASIRAVGVQSQPGSYCDPSVPDTDRCLIFAINGWHRWSNASSMEFDIAIDTTGDGVPDYFVVALDLGAVLAGEFNGELASFTFTAAGDLVDAFYADAPMNGSVVELPALAGDMGITGASPAFSYSITGFDLVNGNVHALAGTAGFDAFAPAVSNGQFAFLASGASTTVPLAVDLAAQQSVPALGWMIVSLDNANGGAQAALLPVGTLPTP